MNKVSSENPSIFIPFSGIEVFSKNLGRTLGSSGKLSKDGMFIETEVSVEDEKKLLLEFKLPGNTLKIKTYSKVMNNLEEPVDNENINGIHLEFVIIDKEDEKRIKEFIESRILNPIIDSDEFTMADFGNIPGKDIFDKTEKFWSFVEDWKQKGNYPLRKFLLSASENRIMLLDEVSNKMGEKINMGSGNYLGLSYHPKVIEAAQNALTKYGTSSVGSPLNTGTFDIHVKLENKLAEMKGCEEVMLFTSGYTTNLGCISALLMKDDIAILDRLAHRSILDGCALAAGNFRTFRHNDMTDLKRVLTSCKDKYNGKVIIVDGVYSNEGDICPLPEIVELAREYDAKVMVDDAHAMGVIGENGKGTISHFNMEGEVELVVGTMSKALGCLGGFVGASKEVINYLRHYGRASVFSCNLAPPVVAASLAAIDIMENEPERIEKLWSNINYLKSNLDALGYNILDIFSGIIPVMIGNDIIGKKMTIRILEEGVYLSYFPYPAVPVGKERLRLTVMSTHTREDLDKTIDIFEKVGKEFGVINPSLSRSNVVSYAV